MGWGRELSPITPALPWPSEDAKKSRAAKDSASPDYRQFPSIGTEYKISLTRRKKRVVESRTRGVSQIVGSFPHSCTLSIWGGESRPINTNIWPRLSGSKTEEFEKIQPTAACLRCGWPGPGGGPQESRPASITTPSILQVACPHIGRAKSKFSATRLRGTWDRLFGCACTVWRVFPLTWRPSAPNLQHKRHGEGGTKNCPVACESRLCKQECRTGRTGEGSQSAWVPNLIVCVCASSCL